VHAFALLVTEYACPTPLHIGPASSLGRDLRACSRGVSIYHGVCVCVCVCVCASCCPAGLAGCRKAGGGGTHFDDRRTRQPTRALLCWSACPQPVERRTGDGQEVVQGAQFQVRVCATHTHTTNTHTAALPCSAIRVAAAHCPVLTHTLQENSNTQLQLQLQTRLPLP